MGPHPAQCWTCTRHHKAGGSPDTSHRQGPARVQVDQNGPRKQILSLGKLQNPIMLRKSMLDRLSIISLTVANGTKIANIAHVTVSLP
jgi:hypothetical protein